MNVEQIETLTKEMEKFKFEPIRCRECSHGWYMNGAALRMGLASKKIYLFGSKYVIHDCEFHRGIEPDVFEEMVK